MGEVDFYLFDELRGDGDKLCEVPEQGGEETGFQADSVSLVFEEEGAHSPDPGFEFVVFCLPEFKFVVVVSDGEA